MIFIDPRFGEKKNQSGAEQRKFYQEQFARMNVPCEPLLMEFGDFSFLGNGPEETPIRIGVELKTVKDFVQSMETGRLDGHQLPGLLDTYKRVYVVVEGFSRASRKNGLLEVPAGRKWRPIQSGRPIFWYEIERFITSVTETGAHVVRTRTPYETAQMIGKVLYGFWDKDYDKHSIGKRLYTPPPPGISLHREDETTMRVRRVAHALNTGIGWGRSKAVAEKFGSVLELAQADADVWESVDGIGKTIARDVHKAIRDQISRPSTGGISKRRGVAPRSTRHSRQR